jgi:hypothetical protein
MTVPLDGSEALWLARGLTGSTRGDTTSAMIDAAPAECITPPDWADLRAHPQSRAAHDHR